MFGLMPIMFTFMFATFPAGLVIYYTWNNLLGVAQQWYIMSRNGVEIHLFKNLGETWAGLRGTIAKFRKK
jgi:YidC/Oxa1 family membrane protein insertase